jgi:peptidoglycan hydrolase CwlO-like protein
MLLYRKEKTKPQRQAMNALDKLSQKIKTFRDSHDEANAKNKELEEKVKIMQQEIDSLRSELAEKDQEIESIVAKIEELLE